MKCPVDGATLQMADREGVEIDYCPQCRGVWLDGKELDRIIDRAMARLEAGGPPERGERGPDDRGDRDDRRDRGDREHYREHDRRGYEAAYHYKKKKDRLGFLSDLLGGD